MTEYDYSPEGYEKYLETQNRVSNWVSEQTARLHQQPRAHSRSISTPPSDYSYHTSSRRPERSHHRSSSSSRRPEPSRSLTTPAEAIPRSMHPSNTHSTAQPIYYSNPAPVSYVAPPAALPQGYNAGYRTYQYDGNSREIVIPRPRPGETYVIIPPSGRRVEVVDSHSSSRSSSRSGGRSPISPSKKDQPLLKRLFTFGGPPAAKLNRSSVSGRRERTRSY